jgi:hypothetical protein
MCQNITNTKWKTSTKKQEITWLFVIVNADVYGEKSYKVSRWSFQTMIFPGLSCTEKDHFRSLKTTTAKTEWICFWSKAEIPMKFIRKYKVQKDLSKEMFDTILEKFVTKYFLVDSIWSCESFEKNGGLKWNRHNSDWKTYDKLSKKRK